MLAHLSVHTQRTPYQLIVELESLKAQLPALVSVQPSVVLYAREFSKSHFSNERKRAYP